VRRGPLLAVAGLTLLGGALRFGTLTLQSFWFDEAVTVGLVGRSLHGMLAAIPGSESTPPLYYVLAWVWTRVFGDSEAGLRSLSALAGTALIPLVCVVVRRLAGDRAGVAAAALAATSPLLIWYSQEARAYALLALLTAASALCALLAAEARPDAGRWAVAWAVVSALALATHYFAGFPVAAEAAYLVWRGRGRPRVRWAPAAVAVVGLALLPLLVEQAGAGRAGFIDDAPLSHRVVQLVKQLLVGYHAPAQAALTVVALIAAAVAVAGLARADAGARRGAVLLAGLAAACAVVPIVLALVGPDYVITRNLIAAWLPALGLVAAGAGAARWRGPGTAAVAALCVAGLLAFVGVEGTPADQRANWRGAARALPHPHGARVVVSDAQAAQVLRLYLPGARPPGPEPIDAAEIDLVATRTQAQRAAGVNLAAVPVPGFGVAARRTTASYAVVVWRRVAGVAAPRYPGAVLSHLASDGSIRGLLLQP
jgi:mannosyltransferase